MASIKRRQFLKSSALAGAAIAFSGRAAWAQSAANRIEIFLDEPRGVISPNIYGQFTEHIGGVIYDGVWVGEHSKIPNRYGIRAALIDHLRQIHVPVIRWPGGCFADSYDWRDGVGPIARRPTRTNFWEVTHDAARLHETGPQIFETNRFGTNEFMRLCQLSGAQPYLAANVRSLPPLSFDHWVEYCNSPAGSTTLARMRAAAGFPQPFHVRYWGVGNESWGCGGNFTPEGYAAAFRRYTTWIPRYGVDLQLIGSGPNGNDLVWTQRFFEEIFTGRYADHNRSFAGWSVHDYSFDVRRRKSDGGKREQGAALQFDSTDWYEVLHECGGMEKILHDQWTVMGAYDKARQVRLVVDEYGPWYREGTEVDPTHLFGQQVTIRDALATALTLDTFNRNAEKVMMAANAQLINNINALFLAHEEKFLATPNFYVFEMYAAHQGGESLRAEFMAPGFDYQRNGKRIPFWGLNGSASRKGSVVTLTVVNPHLSAAAETQVALRGARITGVTGTVLTAGDMHAHNTFEHPDAVHSVPFHAATLRAGSLHVTLPPKSVVKLSLTVA